jgi:hypothetical protein
MRLKPLLHSTIPANILISEPPDPIDLLGDWGCELSFCFHMRERRFCYKEKSIPYHKFIESSLMESSKGFVNQDTSESFVSAKELPCSIPLLIEGD